MLAYTAMHSAGLANLCGPWCNAHDRARGARHGAL